MCFDSAESAHACQEHFKAGTRDYLRHLFDTIKYWFFFCCRLNLDNRRNTSKSTFTRFEDLNDEALAEIYKDTFLEMNRAAQPSDLLWQNMSGQKGLFIIRRASLSTICILVIVFGTTPAFITANFHLQNFPLFSDFIKYFSTNNLYGKYLSPLITILVN